MKTIFYKWADWIAQRIQKTPVDKLIYYKAFYKNKEVQVHTDKRCVFIEWFMDGVKLDNPILPNEYLKEIDAYTSQMIGYYASAGEMYKLVNFLEKYLPYLKDGSEYANLKYVTLNVSLNK